MQEYEDGPFPKELYYTAYKAAVTTKKHKYNWMGGDPLLPKDTVWPKCANHGDLAFLWQIQETENTLLLCFLCVEKDKSSWIWPKYDCMYENRQEVYLCDVSTTMRFAYKFVRVPITKVESRIMSAFIPKQFLCLEKIKLVEAYHEFDSEGDCLIVGNTLIHSDIIYGEARKVLRNAWKNAAFLFKTKGIIEQHEIPRGYGYIVMASDTKCLSFWTLDNPGIVNISRGLNMHHEI